MVVSFVVMSVTVGCISASSSAKFDGFKRFEWQWFLKGDKCGVVLDNNVPELFVKFELFNFDRRLVIHGFS